MRRTMIVLLLGIAMPMMHAKDRRVRSVGSFDSMLARAPYSVVLFYDKSRENMRDPDMKGVIKGLETMMRSLSKDPNYKEADLQFLRVDVARRNMDELATRYRVTMYPTALLFFGREAVGSRLTGKVYREQLEALINQNFGTKMKEIMKEKAAQRKRELERARIRAYQWSAWGPYWYGPYGYGGSYPYWRYGYGRPWGGAYFGW